MKRKHLLTTAAFAIAFASSCTNEDAPMVAGSQDVNPDEINFTTTTTRASVALLSDMTSSLTGFTVYAIYTGDTTDEWLIAGDNNYVYSQDDSAWGWYDTANAPEWPTESTQYPVNFYAIYANDMTGITTSMASTLTSNTSNVVTADVTIQEPTKQYDIIATSTEAATKPSDGKLTLSFVHMLSKVNFGVVAGYKKDVYLNQLLLHNLDENGTLDLTYLNWNISPNEYTADYDVSSYLSSTAYTGTDQSEAIATSITSNDNEGSLMLLPQQATESDVDIWSSDADPTGTYICVHYRTEYDSDDEIGYAQASSHPDYSSPSDDDEYGQTALYVKVGYPLTTNWSWGKGYTYNIKIGTVDASNGYLLDDYYYDESGTKTKYPIDFDKEVGDPISDGTIDFDILVIDWDDSTTAIPVL
ncbi:MAG: hypothetical protein SNG02_03465 [Rikenellaceae bacterium]